MVSDNPEGKKPDEASTGQGPASPSVFWSLDAKSLAPGGAGARGRDRIGNYVLKEVIGEGGMGQVYLAEQTEPVQRTVALKLIRRGMDTREVVARFESERQALALMSHPSIARVFDAGTADDGSPYFVMEHVPGVPITTYCEEKRLGTRARLELFVKVCEAIHHAHQKAIIHRDIKPSNVLVTEIDGTPLPKVIDFGIAKAAAASAVGTTALTAMGQIVGTPDYMSPEQAGSNELDIDTRTDIYSLGVLLYELLTGVLPFDPKKLRQGGYSNLLKTICEEIPPKPSTRLLHAAGLNDAGAKNGAPPSGSRRLARARELRGDLDWITMKALEKDRTRRYGSASELAADVRRHLAYEPVLAGPPSTLYKLRKLARKHREKVIAAIVLLVTLAIFVVASSVHERQLRIGRTRERRLEGDASKQAFADLLVKRNDVAQRLRELTGELAAWLPVWERREESDRLAEEATIKSKLDKLRFEALKSYEKAAQEAPERSEEIAKTLRALEDLNWLQRNEAEENGHVELTEDFFRRQIESLGIGTHARELEGRGEISIQTDPPGAEVYCFRYEEVERRLLPLPFDPVAGVDDPSKGLLGGPFLRVERVWGSKGEPFQPGDQLARVNGTETPTATTLAKSLESVSADRAVMVEVLRGGNTARFDWTPFPSSFHGGFKILKPGRLVDIRFQLDLTFEGYPLDFSPRARLGVTGAGSGLRVILPRGSYLCVIRKEGHAEVRVPLLVPNGPKLSRIHLFKIDDVPPGFVPIPAGEFTFGGDPEAYESLPKGRELVGDLFMARKEATFGEYLEFLNDKAARGDLDEKGAAGLLANWELPELHPFRKGDRIDLKPFIRGALQQPIQPKASGRGFMLSAEDRREEPLVGISMMAAVEYAHWLSSRYGGRWRFRLPRSLEWEKAARGVDRRLYVWGNNSLWSFAKLGLGFVPDRSNSEFTEPALAYPTDESVYGVRDMTGGAGEPTTTLALKGKAYCVYRGGYWIQTDPRDHRVASCNRAIPWEPQRHLGIRLVADPR